jgi:hypothetical protein
MGVAKIRFFAIAIFALGLSGCLKSSIMDNFIAQEKAPAISTDTGNTSTTAPMTYEAKAAPVMINVNAMNSDSLTPVPDRALTTIAQGSDVYIKWRVIGAESGLGNNPITLYYSTDGVNFNLIASGLKDGSNGNCRVDILNYSGCYLWRGGSPTDQFYIVRAKITDLAGQSALYSNTGTNMGAFQVLAGTLDSGIGGSAKAALLFPYSSPLYQHLGRILVDRNQNIYIVEARGLMFISNQTKVLTLLSAFSPSEASVDGPIGVAKIRGIYRMDFDSDENIIFMDADRIRRYSPSSGVITTLVGGGTSATSGNKALEYKFAAPDEYTSSLRVLPNGDIFFINGVLGARQSFNGSPKVSYLRAKDGRVYHLSIDGAGGYGNSSGPVAADFTRVANYRGVYPQSYAALTGFGIEYVPASGSISEIVLKIGYCGGEGCGLASFIARTHVVQDPATGIYTQLITSGVPQTRSNSEEQSAGSFIPSGNGELNYLSHWNGTEFAHLSRIPSPAPTSGPDRTWTPIVPKGTGECDDGTLASACKMDIQDAYVTRDGKIFILDRGLVRTIREDGTVLTLYGQRPNFGDGFNALTARIGRVASFGISDIGEITIYDAAAIRLRAFQPSKSIDTIAGNGVDMTPSRNASALNQGFYSGYWGKETRILVASNGDSYANIGNSIYRLSRLTSLWSCIFSCDGPDTSYFNGDGLPATRLKDGYPPEVLGLSSSALLYSTQTWSAGVYYNAYIKSINLTTGIQSQFAGTPDATNGAVSSYLPNVNAPAATQSMAVNFGGAILPMRYDSVHNGWAGAYLGDKKIKYVDSSGIVKLAATTQKAILAFDPIYDKSGALRIYYCGADSTGSRIYRLDPATGVETALTWPSSQFACTGPQMYYSVARQSIVFATQQFLMSSIAEISDPL